MFLILGLLITAKKPSPVVYPSDDSIMPNLNIYRNYILIADSINDFCLYNLEISLSADLSFRTYFDDSNQNNQWRIINDTLYLYFDWRHSPFNETPPNYLDTNITYDYRNIFTIHQRNRFDSKFPINASIFKIINNGDSLYSISDECYYKGYVISSKAATETHAVHYFQYPAWELKQNSELIDFRDTLVWEKRLKPMSYKYSTRHIDSLKDHILSATMTNGSINFTILNPRYYPQSEALPYAQRREYCEWFDRVNVGDTISLELTRPAYEQEVFDRSPYLKGYPDTIYVLDNEAYGYWFAKPIYNNR